MGKQGPHSFRQHIGRAIRWTMLVVTCLVLALSQADAMGWRFYWGTSSTRFDGWFWNVHSGRWTLVARPYGPTFPSYITPGTESFIEPWRPHLAKSAYIARSSKYDNDVDFRIGFSRGDYKLELGSRLMSALFVLPTLWLWRPARWRRSGGGLGGGSSGASGHCHVCGYAMTGLDRQAVCPECGAGAAV